MVSRAVPPLRAKGESKEAVSEDWWRFWWVVTVAAAEVVSELAMMEGLSAVVEAAAGSVEAWDVVLLWGGGIVVRRVLLGRRLSGRLCRVQCRLMGAAALQSGGMVGLTCLESERTRY